MTPEETTRRAVDLLATLMKIAGISRQEMDRRLGKGRGFTSQILTGRVDLKFEHLMAMLEILELAPLSFMRMLRREIRAPARLGEPGPELMERIEKRFEQLGMAPEPEPTPEPATERAPETYEELERTIRGHLDAALAVLAEAKKRAGGS